MYNRSILRGYDKVTEAVIARALHIPLNKGKQKKHHKGVHRMKIPMSALKKDDAGKKKKGKGYGKAKLSSLKKKQANDNDGDE